MNLSPFFKSPFTDFTSGVVTHQWFGECADMEMKAVDCFEAYGLNKGFTKCQALLDDFQECALKTKRKARVDAMRLERHRQHLAGERTKENKYAEAPPLDSI
ncbi:NADH dehydrogenase (ubiquinone) 15 kDa subunit [Rhynchophorus ferrugineus]|uniref:Complex I-15 kDa n=1 Tax=Rhynchophorus ferrugineus TaxID=354439 RepID=A0A834IKM0_RHYFE|nr:hypothetical protein GWI33_011343 [Rhynchophorus ferrugineus]